MYSLGYNYVAKMLTWGMKSLQWPFLSQVLHFYWPCCHETEVIVIQIKICAEYRDMLPRPRLVCQEPGLRPIGRSPGVPDKSSRGLGSMSRYSSQILICFIAYIFHFFYSSVSLVGNFAGLPVCTVPSDIIHCNQNEAGHQTIKAPSMPCWGETGSGKLSGIYATELVKLTDKMDEICINGKFSAQEPSEWRDFAYLWVILLYFSTESGLISGILEVWLFWNFLIRSGIWQLSGSCQTWVWKSFSGN